MALPTDLEQLFKRMLEGVDPIDHPKMAGILQVAAHALEPLHIDLYYQVQREIEEHDYAYRCPIGAGSFAQVSGQREQTSRSIDEKTKGLLGARQPAGRVSPQDGEGFHLDRDMGSYLRSKLPADYSGFVSIAAMYLGFLKTTRQDPQSSRGSYGRDERIEQRSVHLPSEPSPSIRLRGAEVRSVSGPSSPSSSSNSAAGQIRNSHRGHDTRRPCHHRRIRLPKVAIPGCLSAKSCSGTT